jgi:hypothetical protein
MSQRERNKYQQKYHPNPDHTSDNDRVQYDHGGRERRELADNSNNVADPGRRFRRGGSTNVPSSIIDSVCFQFFNHLLQ